MIDEFAAIGCCEPFFNCSNNTSLTFQHVRNGILHQLLGVLAIGKRHLLQPCLDIWRKMNFHAFKDNSAVYSGASGSAIARHMCATGLLSFPNPSFGCLNCLPITSRN